MIQKLKRFRSQVENLMSQYLPAKALVFLLPIRFSIVIRCTNRGDRQKALRYIEQVRLKRQDIAEVFELDSQRRRSGAAASPLTSSLSDDTLRTLLDRKSERLFELSKSLSQLGYFRIGATFRALLLLRSVLDNHAAGKDKGQRHDAILLEIVANDYCQAIIEKPGVISGSAREKLQSQLQQASEWSIERKVSVFIDATVEADKNTRAQFQGAKFNLQGPSNRDSNLSEMDADTTAVVAYAGPESLVRPVKTVDVSLYLPHKIRQLDKRGSLDVLKDVGLIVVALREEAGLDLCHALVAEHKGTYSNVRFETCGSRFNAGVELFLYVLGSGASGVAITNIDMFINPVYPSGYVANRSEELLERDTSTWRMKRDVVSGAFASHDPSQQYSIYKILHRHDGINYDSVLDRIISAPLSSYIEELENLYGQT